MRINRETLLRIAQDTALEKAHQNHHILAAYLCGSLLEEEYLLGGTADIDLVFIHIDRIPVDREIQNLTAEVHLDIAHHAQEMYLSPRKVRVDPWLGPTVKSCTILYDPRHFMDFIQASVRGQFDRPDLVLERARVCLTRARQIWRNLNAPKIERTPQEVLSYLSALEHSAHTISSLSGKLITERRFYIQFAQATDLMGQPGMARGILGLLGFTSLELQTEAVEKWIEQWKEAYQAIPPDSATVGLHPVRLLYYQRALEAFIASSQVEAVFWPLLRTWTIAVSYLSGDSSLYLNWRKAAEELGLLGQAFAERVVALDAYLDRIEEIVEDWAIRSGA